MYVINYFPFVFDYYFPFGFGYKYFPFGFGYFPRSSRKSCFDLNETLEMLYEYLNTIPDLDSEFNDDDE